jgi:hypothetical protein
MRPLLRRRIEKTIERLQRALDPGIEDSVTSLHITLGQLAAVELDLPFLIHEARAQLEEKENLMARALAAEQATAEAEV